MIFDVTLEPGEYFDQYVSTLTASKMTKAYIVGLCLDQASGKRIVDMSTESIVLAHVFNTGGFIGSQTIADWAFWLLSFYAENVNGHRDAVETIGRLNYARCHRQVPSWYVFDEMSDMLPVYTRQLAQCVHA